MRDRILIGGYLFHMSARPFTDIEFTTLSEYFLTAGRTRDRLIFIMGCGTGFRITELLSLCIGDVILSDCKSVASEVTIARRNLKGGKGAYQRAVRGRRVVLSESIREAIKAHLATLKNPDPSTALFTTAKARGRPMGRSMTFKMLRDACLACGINSTRISTHSLRKTFVTKIYRASGNDLIATQRIVGHTNPATTARYLETDADELDDLVRNLAA